MQAARQSLGVGGWAGGQGCHMPACAGRRSDTTQVGLLVGWEGPLAACHLHPQVPGAKLLVHVQRGPGRSPPSQPFQVASEANSERRPLSRAEVGGPPAGRGPWPDNAALRPLWSAAVSNRASGNRGARSLSRGTRQGAACLTEACVCGFCQRTPGLFTGDSEAFENHIVKHASSLD